jgi:hypothetical protein
VEVGPEALGLQLQERVLEATRVVVPQDEAHLRVRLPQEVPEPGEAGGQEIQQERVRLAAAAVGKEVPPQEHRPRRVGPYGLPQALVAPGAAMEVGGEEDHGRSLLRP